MIQFCLLERNGNPLMVCEVILLSEEEWCRQNVADLRQKYSQPGSHFSVLTLRVFSDFEIAVRCKIESTVLKYQVVPQSGGDRS